MDERAPNKSAVPQDAAEPTPKKAKSPVPTTLSEFTAARGGSARAFLRKLKKGAVLIPSREEIEELAKKLIDRSDGGSPTSFIAPGLSTSQMVEFVSLSLRLARNTFVSNRQFPD